MATEIVKASLTISFNAEDTDANRNDLLVLQVDDREPEEGGLNNGETSFRPGDSVYILLYRATTVSLDLVDSTAGTLTGAGSGSRPVRDVLSVTDSLTANLTYPNGGNMNRGWLGQSFDVDGQAATISAQLIDGTYVLFSEKANGLYQATYDADFVIYRLSSVPLAIDQVVVFAHGTVTI